MRRNWILRLFGREPHEPHTCKTCGAGLSQQYLLSAAPATKQGVKFSVVCRACGTTHTISGSDMQTRAAYLQLLNQPTREYTSSARWVL